MSSNWDGKALDATPSLADEFLSIDASDGRNQKRVTIQSIGGLIWQTVGGKISPVGSVDVEFSNLFFSSETITPAGTNTDLVLQGTGTGNVSVGNNKILLLATPTIATDAANKAYVDASVTLNWTRAAGILSPTTATDKLQLANNFSMSPRNPILAGSVGPVGDLGDISDIQVVGNYAYVSNLENDSIRVIDVTDPASPVLLTGGLQDTTNLDSVTGLFVSGKYAFGGSSVNNRLAIVDISNPGALTLAGFLSSGDLDGYEKVFVAGGFAYIVCRGATAKFVIVDFHNVEAPKITTALQNATLVQMEDVFVHGKYAYIASGGNNRLITIDVTDTVGALTIGGNLQRNTEFAGISAVVVQGRYAYVTSFTNDTMSVVDISNPLLPVLVGTTAVSTTLMQEPTDIKVSGNYAYVCSEESKSVAVVDVSDPTSPTIVASIVNGTNLSQAQGIDVVGNFAYVAAFGDNRMQILDLAGIDAPGANIGNIKAGNATIQNRLDVGGRLGADSLSIGKGGMSCVGDIVIGSNQKARLVLGGMDGDDEGGEILWKGGDNNGSPHDDWQQDLFFDTMRLFTNSATDETVLLFNAGAAKMNLRVDGSLHVGSDAPPLSTMDIHGSQGIEVKRASGNTTTTPDVTDPITLGVYIIAITNSSAPRTVTLQTADTVAGREYIINDEGGQAGTFNITVDTQGSQTIDGKTSVPIVADHGSLNVYSDGVNWFTRDT